MGYASVEEIDKINILEATKLSMKRVINKFSIDNPNLIIDGNFSLHYQNEKSIIGGDKKSLSIASASIISGAGGKITDWNDNDLNLQSDGRILATGDSNIHKQIIKIIQK